MLAFRLLGLAGVLIFTSCTTLVMEEITIGEIHARFRSGDLTSRQLVQAYFDRIALHDAPRDLNAYVVLNPRALERASELDAEFARTGELRALHGIPVVIKDNCDTHDLQTTAGCLALAGSLPPDDCFLVARIREAGGVVLGKSNMDEWAFSPHKTVSSILGITRNPYDLSRVPAGSSGGTAAAVSANLAVVGIGTDTGNSIRGPSAHCALVGIRPTIGLTSRDGIVPLSLSADVAGPMSRTVEDAARLLGVIAGYDPADPATLAMKDREVPDYTQFLKTEGLRGARIGVLRTKFSSPTTDEEVIDVMEQAIADLERLGATVVDNFELPARRSAGGRGRRGGGNNSGFRAGVDLYLASLGPDAPAHSLSEIVESGDFHPSLAERLSRSVQGPPPDLSQVQLSGVDGDPAREAFRDDLVAAMDELDLDAIIYPTWSNIPRLIGDMESPHGDNSQSPAPRAGMPALTVPMGYTRTGLPAGLQMLGRPFDEGRLIELAYSYEQGTDHRRPPPGFGDSR